LPSLLSLSFPVTSPTASFALPFDSSTTPISFTSRSFVTAFAVEGSCTRLGRCRNRTARFSLERPAQPSKVSLASMGADR
jgi:hypothetical protein